MKILLVPSDPVWPQVFEEERSRIKVALGPLILKIEHIGSTSVPRLMAKPVIDMQIGVADIAKFDAGGGVAKMEALGYQHNTHFLSVVPFRRLFSIPPADDTVGFNIHTVSVDHPWWERHLFFRDYLRKNEDAMNRYEAEKLRLADKEWESTADYAGAKTGIIIALEEEAFDWAALPEERRDFLRSGRIDN